MSQVIQIQLGQCGNRMGQSFSQQLAQEHNINQDGSKISTQKLQVQNLIPFFSENSKGIFRTRNILADLQPATIDSILGQKYAKLNKLENIVQGWSSASNNWAKGYYGYGSENIQYLMDSIRRQAEECQKLSCFQVLHSIGGGTGSGMGSLLLKKLQDHYPCKIKTCYTVFPSKSFSSNILQHYNSVFAFAEMREETYQCFCLDNDGLSSMCSNQKPATFRDLNNVVGNAICGITCGSRFPGLINQGIRKNITNMVPFPYLKFLTVGTLAKLSSQKQNKIKNDGFNLVHQLFNKKNWLSSVNPKDGKNIVASILFRGAISTSEAQNAVFQYINFRRSSYFVEWIPNNVRTTYCKMAPKGIQLAGTLVTNTTAIKGSFQQLLVNFNKLFKKKAYMHWYTSEGMDQLQFKSRSNNLKQVIGQYKNYQYATNEQDVNYQDQT